MVTCGALGLGLMLLVEAVGLLAWMRGFSDIGVADPRLDLTAEARSVPQGRESEAVAGERRCCTMLALGPNDRLLPVLVFV